MTQDWRGKRHARMTRSMFDLSAGPFKVLSGLRMEMKDGETRDDLSQAMIADLANVSEATVSRAMPILQDAGYIRWTKNNPDKRGRGAGHTLTLLPPPEMGSASDPSSSEGSETREEGSHLQEKGSALQDAPKYPMPPVQTPQTAVSEGSDADPCILMIHAVDPITTNSASESGTAQPKTPVVVGGASRRGLAAAAAPVTETEALLLDFGFSPTTAREFAALPLAAVRSELAAAHIRGTGPGALVSRWRVRPPKAGPASLSAPAHASIAPPKAGLTQAEIAAIGKTLNPFGKRSAGVVWQSE